MEQSSLATWQLSEEVDVTSLPSASLPSSHSVTFSTPTQTGATLDGASASLVAQALQQSQAPLQGRGGLGNREADGGWCISWCKERYWGEVIAAGCGISGTIKVGGLYRSFPFSSHLVGIIGHSDLTVSSTDDTANAGPISLREACSGGEQFGWCRRARK